jgi:predicted site-specific integrase-resolvase
MMVDHRALRFTAAEAGPLLGVEPKTITQWAARGHLHSVGLRGAAYTYSWGELVEVERTTRRSGHLPRPRQLSDDR